MRFHAPSFKLFPARLRSIAAGVLFTSCAFAQSPESAFKPIEAEKLNRAAMTPLEIIALDHPAQKWSHAESTNFVFHFTDPVTAAAVSTEAEFFYRVIAKELERDTSQWERKAHIFLFDTDESWKAFQRAGEIDPRTGGIHSAGALFLKRHGAGVLNDETLAHEIAHLVVGRFFGGGVPLWLSEGFAENSAIRCRAAFYRARYRAVSAESYIPLAELTTLARYPGDSLKMLTFYDESEKLTRFLMSVNRKAFGALMDALAKGNRFETALAKAYGNRFMNLDALEREFKPFATSSVVPSNP